MKNIGILQVGLLVFLPLLAAYIMQFFGDYPQAAPVAGFLTLIAVGIGQFVDALKATKPVEPPSGVAASDAPVQKRNWSAVVRQVALGKGAR